MEDYSRHAKEEFVAGLGGTTLGEISLITVTLAAGYLLKCTAVMCLPAVNTLKGTSTMFSFLLEYVTIVLPGVLVFTVLADSSVYVLLSGLCLCILLVLFALQRIPQPLSVLRQLLDLPCPGRLPFVTLYRTYVNLFTAIAILAVDFHIYPRRLAKAETYGSGLMDVGVGCFLLAHGLTAPEARHPEDFRSVPNLRSYLKTVRVTFRAVLPLFVLGLLRLMSVKSTNYQEHVTEYGVHWNFFFTIAVVRLLCTVLHPALHLPPPHWHPYGLLALLIAAAYQSFLSLAGGSEYLMWGPHGDGSRPTLFSANREGVVSCVGYLAIYLGGVELGKWLFSGRHSLKGLVPVLLQVTVLDAMFWLLTSCSDAYVEPISRRFVNLSYILWMVSHGQCMYTIILWMFSYCLLMVGVFLAIDLLVVPLSHALGHSLLSPLYMESSIKKDGAGTKETVSHTQSNVCIISAVDYNQLLFFVMANVFTGAVNVTVDTLRAGALWSLTILLLYMMTLVGIFVLLHTFRIKVKL